MNQKSLPTYMDPTIQYLTQVLAQVREGSLRVPRFQRPFIWQEDKQLELLRSIREGIPIGAVMVWRTTDAPVEYYRKLGRYTVAVKQDARPQQYLLDGVQRITTLYAALIPTEMSSDTGSVIDDRKAFYSFVDDDFVFASEEGPDIALMPLSVLSDTHALIKYQRHLADNDRHDWLLASDAIASAFREYKIPIIPINTDDISVATRTFQRVNTQGARMSDLHMIHALTWAENFDLQDKLASLKEDLLGPLRWANVDDEVILKVCKGLRGLNLYKTEPQKLSDLLRETPLLLNEAVSAIAWAAEYLRTNLKIYRSELVPYAFQIVFLALARPLIQMRKGDLFRDWFWFTTYTEAFSGMSDDKVRRALDDFQMMLKLGQPVWSNQKKSYTLPSKRDVFNPLAVRSKATLLCLARKLESVGIDGFKDLGDFGREAIHPLFVKPFIGNASSIGNKILVAPDAVRSFRDRLNFGFLNESELEGHFLSSLQQQSVFDEPVDEIDVRANNVWHYEVDFAEGTAGSFNQSLQLRMADF